MRKRQHLVAQTALIAALLVASAFAAPRFPISPALKQQYAKDAARLVLRAEGGQHPERLGISLPADKWQSVQQALLAIHESSEPAAQEVTRTHKLHTFPDRAVDKMAVIFKRNAKWAMPLRLGDNSLDDDKLMALLERHQIELRHQGEWDAEHNMLYLQSNEPLNFAALAPLFQALPGVKTVDLLVPSGDGNDIVMKDGGSDWLLDYQVKFNNCLKGCENAHVWSFKVNKQTQTVHFLKESGDPLPDWMRRGKKPLASRE